MKDKKKFSTSLFGYKKSDVYNFLESLTKDYAKQEKKNSDKITELTEENKGLKEKLDQLEQKVHDVEEGRAHIANAIIKAEQQAEDIIANAVESANLRKVQIKDDIKDEEDKVQEVKNTLHNLKLDAIKVIKEFERQINGLADMPEEEVEIQVAATDEDVYDDEDEN